MDDSLAIILKKEAVVQAKNLHPFCIGKGGTVQGPE